MVELTKFGTYTNYKVPPESTGARIAHYEHWYFKVTGLGSDFLPPATYVLAAGIHGIVVSKDAFDGGYRVLVTANRDSATTGFVVDDTFTITDSLGQVQTGLLKEWGAVLLQQTAIVDALKPDHNLAVDSLGAASVRFSEGEPTFDPYGLIRMSQPARIADYVFRYTTNSTNWQQKVTGTGAIVHLQNQSSIALDCGSASGDSISYTTNRAHRYTPGVAHLITMSVHTGDTGKTGNIRHWGLYNDRNGFFFELNGSTMNVGIRSSISGTPVDTIIPQSEWNLDRVDGSGGETNRSAMNLHPEFQNVYWIDFQWHGAGVVRFGTFTPVGKRIVMHVVQHANNVAGPYMETATLPFRVSCKNTSGTASPSRLALTGCAIFKEGEVGDDGKNNNAFIRSLTIPNKTINGTAFTCVGAFRAAGTHAGVPNNKAIIPRQLSYYSTKDCQVLVRGGSVLDGTETWASAAPGSSAEYSSNPVAAFEGVQASGIYMSAGPYAQAVSESFNTLGQNLIAYADATPGSMYTVWVKCMNAAETGTFDITLDWVEL